MSGIEVLGILTLFLIGLTVGMSLRHAKCRRKRCSPIERTKRESIPNQHWFQSHGSARQEHSVIQAQVAVLDQIADEADRDILRLEELLQEIREVPTARLAGFGEDSERSSDERCLLNDESAEFVKVLHRSGFSAEEIAGSMHASLDLIREILHESDDGSSKAA